MDGTELDRAPVGTTPAPEEPAAIRTASGVLERYLQVHRRPAKRGELRRSSRRIPGRCGRDARGSTNTTRSRTRRPVVRGPAVRPATRTTRGGRDARGPQGAGCPRSIKRETPAVDQARHAGGASNTTRSTTRRSVDRGPLVRDARGPQGAGCPRSIKRETPAAQRRGRDRPSLPYRPLAFERRSGSATKNSGGAGSSATKVSRSASGLSRSTRRIAFRLRSPT
jgi:hypothetical protein